MTFVERSAVWLLVVQDPPFKLVDAGKNGGRRGKTGIGGFCLGFGRILKGLGLQSLILLWLWKDIEGRAWGSNLCFCTGLGRIFEWPRADISDFAQASEGS